MAFEFSELKEALIQMKSSAEQVELMSQEIRETLGAFEGASGFLRGQLEQLIDKIEQTETLLGAFAQAIKAQAEEQMEELEYEFEEDNNEEEDNYEEESDTEGGDSEVEQEETEVIEATTVVDEGEISDPPRPAEGQGEGSRSQGPRRGIRAGRRSR